ncbi:hypothetical protein PUN4_490065 [Paraburkholderia unamae]|nr:hypothetical protein PUN4_490065 [Paraburkholderia unamae]
MRAVLRRNRRADLRRHGAAAHLDQRLGVRHGAGRQSARPVPRIARPLRDAAREHARAALARQAVPRRAHAHRATARAPRRASRRSRRGLRAHAAKRRRHRPDHVQARARHPPDDLRDGRGARAPASALARGQGQASDRRGRRGAVLGLRPHPEGTHNEKRAARVGPPVFVSGEARSRFSSSRP